MSRPPFDGDVAVGDEFLDPLGHRGSGQAQAFADPGLEDPLALLAQLEDGLEVFLGGRIQLVEVGRTWAHGDESIRRR